MRIAGRCTDGLFCLFLRRSKITELEEELKVVGNNMKSLEISEQEVVLACCSCRARAACVATLLTRVVLRAQLAFDVRRLSTPTLPFLLSN